MKLKTRIVASFCIIIILPVALMMVALFGYYQLRVSTLHKDYGMTTESVDNILSNSVQLLNQYTNSDFEEILDLSTSDTSTLESLAYLKKENDLLEEKSSYLIFRKGNEIAYNGAGDMDSRTDQEWLDSLPKYGYSKANANAGYYSAGKNQSLMKQVDFICTDGSEGSIFIITSSSSMLPETKQLVIELILTVVLILAITAALMTIWIYRSTMMPIKKLQVAAKNIKDGNLDFTIDYDDKDELGELCRDFEEMRKRLKESAEEKVKSEQENRVLISNIAHDLKTPITAVKGYSEGLLDGVAATPEKQNRYLKTIYNKANEMDRLINELTLYSRIDTNRIPYNFNKINVAEYFADCVAEIGLDLETKNIGLTYFNYADDKVQIIADPEQLMRVINNIISNSVKYMDSNKKGQINIRIKDVGDFIQFEIEDNGKGIAMKDQPYIFDRFYRTDASRNSKTGGSGIGLSIVKKIIEDHGGKIWVTSKLNSGSTMYFVLRKYTETPILEQTSADKSRSDKTKSGKGEKSRSDKTKGGKGEKSKPDKSRRPKGDKNKAAKAEKGKNNE